MISAQRILVIVSCFLVATVICITNISCGPTKDDSATNRSNTLDNDATDDTSATDNSNSKEDLSTRDAQPGSADDYDAILKKYVKGDYFQYKLLLQNKEDMQQFERFMEWQADADVSKMSREDQIAFYSNAYNSCCIKAILDNYPVHTPKDVDGFFDKLKFKVAGEELTVSEIEHDRLIANYEDMRAHFAVVCSDRGCLPLKSGAYTGKQLNDDLEASAQRFVKDERHFKVDHEKDEVHISKIFEWYGPKFLKDPVRKVDGDRPEVYLTHWVDKDVKEMLEAGKYKLKIIEWDWTINEGPYENNE